MPETIMPSAEEMGNQPDQAQEKSKSFEELVNKHEEEYQAQRKLFLDNGWSPNTDSMWTQAQSGEVYTTALLGKPSEMPGVITAIFSLTDKGAPQTFFVKGDVPLPPGALAMRKVYEKIPEGGSPWREKK